MDWGLGLVCAVILTVAWAPVIVLVYFLFGRDR